MKDPSDMIHTELKEWLADRLRMRGPASADLNLRADEAPFEKPLRLWKIGADRFHHEFLRAVLTLVEEAAVEPWPAESFDQLMRLIEAGRILEATGALESLAHSHVFLANEHTAQLHMQTLRTLLAVGWTGSLEFWLAQERTVGSRWPALVFKGLARHDLNIAFDELPSLAIDGRSMRQILDLLPALMRDQHISLATLRDDSRRVLAYLAPEAANALKQWFAFREIHLTPIREIVHISLSTALVDELGDEIVPRTYAAALVNEVEEELEYA